MKTILLILSIGMSLPLCAQSFSWNKDQVSQSAADNSSAISNTGLAHFYPDYYENSPTALGEIFRHNLMTAGHQKFPLGTIVTVTRVDNGLSTTVRINDRGAYCDGCVIDLSRVAAEEIDLFEGSRTRVELKVVGHSDINPSPSGSTRVDHTEFTARGGDLATTDAYNFVESNSHYTPPVKKNCPPEQVERKPELQARGADLPQQNITGIATIEFPISPFFVQLGAYVNYSNAEKHILRMQAKGFGNIFLLKEQQANATILNRVIVAPFATSVEAEKYVNDLAVVHQLKGIVFTTTVTEYQRN